MAAAESTLLDGAGQRPQFSLRTLCRALGYTARQPYPEPQPLPFP